MVPFLLWLYWSIPVSFHSECLKYFWNARGFLVSKSLPAENTRGTGTERNFPWFQLRIRDHEVCLPPSRTFHLLWFYGFWVSDHCLDFKSQGVITWLVNLRMVHLGLLWFLFVSLFVCLDFVLWSSKKICQVEGRSFLRGRKMHVWHLEMWKLLLSANDVPGKCLGATEMDFTDSN